jgi:hypothetical protein
MSDGQSHPPTTGPAPCGDASALKRSVSSDESGEVGSAISAWCERVRRRRAGRRASQPMRRGMYSDSESGEDEAVEKQWDSSRLWRWAGR